jgi:hypothetical protein
MYYKKIMKQKWKKGVMQLRGTSTPRNMTHACMHAFLALEFRSSGVWNQNNKILGTE